MNNFKHKDKYVGFFTKIFVDEADINNMNQSDLDKKECQLIQKYVFNDEYGEFGSEELRQVCFLRHLKDRDIFLKFK